MDHYPFQEQPSSGFMSTVNSWFTTLWLSLIRPLVKGFLRRTTGLCELQRICYGSSPFTAERCLSVESSLKLSRSKVIHKIRSTLILNCDRTGAARFKMDGRLLDKELTDEDEAQVIEYAVDAVCIDKNIKSTIHKEFVLSLRTCLMQLFYYKKVAEEALELAAVHFDKSNPDHSGLLVKLWYNLKSTEKEPNQSANADKRYDDIGIDWTEIGFQGIDPSTDFRGMGILGLAQLVYFTENFKESSQNIFLHSNHPIQGFPFAITGINLTHLVVHLMVEGHLKTNFFNQSTPFYWIEDMHKVYSYLFIAFNTFWIKESPENVMQFGIIRGKFIQRLIEHLADRSATIFNWSCPSTKIR